MVDIVVTQLGLPCGGPYRVQVRDPATGIVTTEPAGAPFSGPSWLKLDVGSYEIRVVSFGRTTDWVTVEATCNGKVDLTFDLPAVEVEIDIKPGSDPSSFGCDSKGNIPVAVLGSSTFDATALDADTVLFGVNGNETGEVHKKKGAAKRHVEDFNEDGFLDMIFHFDFSATGFECSDIPAGQGSVTLDGTLTGLSGGGIAFAGISDIRLTSGKGKNK